MISRTIKFAALFAAAAVSHTAMAATEQVDVAWKGNAALTGERMKAFVDGAQVYGGSRGALAHELGYTQLAAGTSTSFEAFCIEPTQPNSKLAATYEKSVLGGTEGKLLAALYTTSYKTGAGAAWDSVAQAAFQTAVWELTQEKAVNGSTTYGILDGNFSVTGASGVTSLASTFLASALSYTGTSTYSVYKLTSADYQDLVVASPFTSPAGVVPEPESYALLLAGLGVVAWVARRRQAR